MSLVNYTNREINVKIVYYGPALSGKTTNLQLIHRKLNPKQRGKLISLATEMDRTLFFDFLPVNIGDIKGFKTKFHLYTVPGQVHYNETRKTVLKGVDGIVFVADSQTQMMDENRESLQNLKENLKDHNKDIKDIPFVIQYNKRDLENAADIEELNRELNQQGVPTFEAVAIDGKGVLETFTSVSKLTLKMLRGKETLEDEEKAEEDELLTRLMEKREGVLTPAPPPEEKEEIAPEAPEKPGAVVEEVQPPEEEVIEEPVSRYAFETVETRAEEVAGEKGAVEAAEFPESLEMEKREKVPGQKIPAVSIEGEISLGVPKSSGGDRFTIPVMIGRGEKSRGFNLHLTVELEEIKPQEAGSKLLEEAAKSAAMEEEAEISAAETEAASGGEAPPVIEKGEAESQEELPEEAVGEAPVRPAVEKPEEIPTGHEEEETDASLLDKLGEEFAKEPERAAAEEVEAEEEFIEKKKKGLLGRLFGMKG